MSFYNNFKFGKRRLQGVIVAPILQKAAEENVPNMTVVQTWTIITFLTNWLNMNNPMVVPAFLLNFPSITLFA